MLIVETIRKVRLAYHRAADKGKELGIHILVSTWTAARGVQLEFLSIEHVVDPIFQF